MSTRLALSDTDNILCIATTPFGSHLIVYRDGTYRNTYWNDEELSAC